MSPLMVMLQVIVFFFVLGECVHNQLNVTCSEYERNALLDFKTGLEDPLNKLGSWNNGSSNCCQWWGIGCNKAGTVITVDLRNRYDHFWGFGGKIRPSLTKLKSLRHLDLSYNTFMNIPIPGFFGSLKHLRYLNLSYARFSGWFPSNIGNLSRLEYLDLEALELLYVDNLEWITGLVSLKHLKMDGVDLSMVGLDWFGIILNKLPSLAELHMSSCSLKGPFPSVSFVNSTTSLAVLDLSFNNFNSKIPHWLANISSLLSVDISDGGLHGRIPLGFAELPNLQTLRLRTNYNLNASCFEIFRGRWKSIKFVDLSNNKVQGRLPTSIGNMTSLTYLDLSKNNVQGGIPGSIGKLCNLNWLDMSYNKLNGTLPELLEGTHSCHSESPLPSLEYLHLKNNELVGLLPQWLGQLRNLVKLILNKNLLNDGLIPNSIGNIQYLNVLDLSSNNIIGNIPLSFGKLSSLNALDLSKNNLSGTIPKSFGQLSALQTLHLGDNKLSGNIPSSFQNLLSLETLDLGNNRLAGNIPHWLGKSWKNLRILKLRSNAFLGELPSVLSNLSSLQVLDLADNGLNGSIPASFGYFRGMIHVEREKFLISYGIDNGTRKFYEENMDLIVSGRELKYTKILSLVVTLDLSSNNLSGVLPSKLTNLLGLVNLNLSNNHINGSVQEDISKLSQLLSLDLSNNRLSGTIPNSLSSLSFLGRLNLSNNDFFGKIPYNGHMTTFEASSFVGNQGLCGEPLNVKCPGDNGTDFDKQPTPKDHNDDDDNFIDKWFYLSVGLGFAAGLLVPFFMMAMKKSWSETYFGFVENVVERYPFFERRMRAKRQWPRGLHH
ncbi:hypothetical protein CsatB_018696 [Cannabis sativa]